MIHVTLNGQPIGEWVDVSVHSRAVVTPGPRAEAMKPHPLAFAGRLKRCYRAGQHSRLQALPRNPPYDDYDLALAWVIGYDATQREIDEWEEGEVA